MLAVKTSFFLLLYAYFQCTYLIKGVFRKYLRHTLFEQIQLNFNILAFLKALIDQFICMSHYQKYSSSLEQNDHFLIIHNHRNRKDSQDSTTKHKRKPHDYSADRKSIILTRTMKAKLEQEDQSVKPDESAQVEKESQQKFAVQEGENSEFFNENQLQKGIPLSDSQDEDILYNRNEMSWASNYSKLQKTLFAMSFPSVQKQQEEEQQNYKNEV